MTDKQETKTPEEENRLDYVLDMTCQLADMANDLHEKHLSESLRATAELRRNYDLKDTKAQDNCTPG